MRGIWVGEGIRNKKDMGFRCEEGGYGRGLGERMEISGGISLTS